MNILSNNFEKLNYFFFDHPFIPFHAIAVFSALWIMFYSYNEPSPFIKRQFQAIKTSLKITGLIYVSIYSYFVIVNSSIEALLTTNSSFTELIIKKSQDLTSFGSVFNIGIAGFLILALTITSAIYLNTKFKLSEKIKEFLGRSLIAAIFIGFLIFVRAIVYLNPETTNDMIGVFHILLWTAIYAYFDNQDKFEKVQSN